MPSSAAAIKPRERCACTAPAANVRAQPARASPTNGHRQARRRVAHRGEQSRYTRPAMLRPHEGGRRDDHRGNGGQPTPARLGEPEQRDDARHEDEQGDRHWQSACHAAPARGARAATARRRPRSWSRPADGAIWRLAGQPACSGCCGLGVAVGHGCSVGRTSGSCHRREDGAYGKPLISTPGWSGLRPSDHWQTPAKIGRRADDSESPVDLACTAC